jgi:uncharacterized protein involved in exopolysaccharide biosynthesis
MDSERQQAMFLRSQQEIARAERSTAALAANAERGGTPGAARATQLTTAQLTSGSLEELQTELDRMRGIYTDKHPDVIALERRVEELKKQGGSSSARPDALPPGSARDGVGLQLATISGNIEGYKKQIEQVNEQIELYKQRVERAPQIEMELNKILRGYETVRQRYDNVLSRKMDAKMAEELERRKKGEQFRVLDLAVRPPLPFKPDPLRTMLMALAAGLGLGFGLAYLREMLDPAFYSPEEIEVYLKTEVIATLPTADKEAR